MSTVTREADYLLDKSTELSQGETSIAQKGGVN
jgi:hypothetical protein